MLSKLIWPILLQLAGILVIIAEFIIPSAGILTVLSIGVFGFSLYLVFANVSATTGLTFLIFDILLIPVVLFIGIRFLAASPATLKATLSSKDGSSSQPPEWSQLPGANGEAITDLHPAGTAVINGKRHDVISRGEYISKGSPITVINVDSNRIVVKKI
jgi:membrane-bound serine protease (ClpP class)